MRRRKWPILQHSQNRVKSNENVTEGEWLRQMKMLLSDAGTSQGGPARERGRLDLSPRRSSLFGLRPAPFFLCLCGRLAVGHSSLPQGSQSLINLFP